MTRQAIDRLGALSYGSLLLGVINGYIQSRLSQETLNSWPVLIPLLAVNLVGLTAVFYCLSSFIVHLFTENKRLGGAGKALWLVLLLLGHLVTMPVYWYCHIVRERLADGDPVPSGLGKATPASKT
jgi:hypothetical protein